MKVIHFHSGPWYGGVESLLVNLFEYRSFASGVEPVFVLMYKGRLSNELEKRGAAVEIIPAPREGRIWTMVKVWFQLRRVIKKYDAEAFVSHEIEQHNLAWPMVGLLPVKSVLWIHSSGFRLRSPVYKKLRTRIPDLAICDSRHVMQEASELWPELKAEFLYPPTTRPSGKGKYPSQEGKVMLVYVGRLVAYKGLAELIEALSLIKELPFECIIVGGSKQEREQKFLKENQKKVEELGIKDRVAFVGFQEDVMDYLLSADVFVHPNLLPEPFGIVFMLALFASTPIVATDIGGAKEILDTQPKKMGDLVPPGDKVALASVLRKYIEDKDYRHQISANIKESFVNICEPAVSMEKLSDMLHA